MLLFWHWVYIVGLSMRVKNFFSIRKISVSIFGEKGYSYLKTKSRNSNEACKRNRYLIDLLIDNAERFPVKSWMAKNFQNFMKKTILEFIFLWKLCDICWMDDALRARVNYMSTNQQRVQLHTSGNNNNDKKNTDSWGF